MSLLITGCAGRVGRALHVHLARRQAVAGLDRQPASNVTWCGEIDDDALLQRALRGVQAVVHTAALHAPHVGVRSDAEFARINVAGTQRVYEAAARAGVRRFVFTSTTALYGLAATPAQRAGWVDDALTPDPETIYHRTKLAAEAWLTQAAREGGPSVRILRMSRCFPEPVDVMAVYRLHRGIDARDVAAAHAAALTHEGDAVECFVISGATPFRRDDVEALLHDAPAVLAARAPALVAAFAQRGLALPQSIDRVYSPQRARERLGWEPRYGFEAVLRQYDEESSEVLPPQRDWQVRE